MKWFGRKKARGGLIPGDSPGGDSIRVRLSPGSAFVSDAVRDQLGDDGVRRVFGLSENADIYSPRDWPSPLFG